MYLKLLWNDIVLLNLRSLDIKRICGFTTNILKFSISLQESNRSYIQQFYKFEYYLFSFTFEL